MNFLDYPAYVMGCLGIGDIICSFNALENIGRERERKIDAYVVDRPYFQRVFDIYNAMDLKLVNLHFSDFDSVVTRVGSGEYTVFQAFGMEVSWVKGWLGCWGLRSNIGHDNMVAFKGDKLSNPEAVGVSFTVSSNPRKNISKDSAIKVINDMLDQGDKVVYFGFRRETDSYLEKRFGVRLSYCDYDLSDTIRMIGYCQRFVGADSGMAWISAFHRVETKILIGRSFGWLPNTFGDIPWVSIDHEDQ